MEEITDVIQRRVWTVEELRSQLSDLQEDWDSLSAEEKERAPRFSGDWSEKSVRKYLGDLERAVKDPIKYRSRERLEQFTVDTDRISDDVLANGSGVDRVIELMDQVIEIDGRLVTGDHLTAWLRNGLDEARGKLREIINAKPAFERVLESDIDENLRSGLLEKAVMNVGFLEEAKALLQQLATLRDLQVVPEYDGDLEGFCEGIGLVTTLVEQVQERYGVPSENIETFFGDITLQETNMVLEKLCESWAEEEVQLKTEWNTYASTLRSLDEVVPQPPEYLVELQQGIESLRDRCLEHLGKSGLGLLRFIRGEAEFPEVEMGEVKRFLETLRPFLLRSLEES